MSQRYPKGKGNKEVFHTPQISRTEILPPDAVKGHTQDSSFFLGVTYPSTENTVSIPQRRNMKMELFEANRIF